MAGSLSWHELAWNKPRGLIFSNRSDKLLDEMLINSLVMTILTVAVWACLFPDDALAVLAELKRQLRMRVIRRHGEANARILKRKLLDYFFFNIFKLHSYTVPSDHTPSDPR